MSYPTAYRKNVGPQNTVRRFLRDESGFLRFPDGRGRWNPPPTPLRRAPQATPLRPRSPHDPIATPDTRPGRGPLEPAFSPGTYRPNIWRAAGRIAPWALIALELWNAQQPHASRGPFVAPGQLQQLGWNHICGPFAYPGAPYRNQVHSAVSNAPSAVCLEPLPLQSLAGQVDVVPNPSTKTVIYAYGPHELLLPLNRYYTFDRYSVAVDQVPQLSVFMLSPPPLPSPLVPFVPPGFYEVMPSPTPLDLVPLVELSPFAPYATERGVAAPLEYPSPAPRTDAAGLSLVPKGPDVRPRPREHERKVAPEAGAVFRVIGSFASWSAVVNALWRSLPYRYRTPGANVAQKIQDIYRNYRHLRLDKAAENLVKYWFLYKLAGWAYGRSQRELVRLFGQDGYLIYRGLVNAGLL